MNANLTNNIDDIIADLLSVPPLIFRGIRRKLIKSALSNINLDVTPLHFEIMKLLNEAGTLHIAEIGQRLLIARAQMTHLIDRLENLNMVQRRMNPSDRRMTDILLTSKGKTFIQEHENNLRNAVKDAISQFTDEELENLHASLKKLRNMLSKL